MYLRANSRFRPRRIRLRGDRGSVMMEFIIVLPIYLCLFGGLFLTGEILLGRERLPENDRILAWLCEYCGKDDLVGVVTAPDRFKILTDHDENAGWEVDTTNLEKWVGALDPSSQNYQIGNNYLTLYSSHMSVKMTKIPAWIRGPLSAVSIFSGNGNPWEDFSFTFDQMTDYDSHDNARHYVFKRVAAVDADYDRKVAPAELATGIVWNIVGDTWPSESTTPAVGGNSYDNPEYNRSLTEFGE